MNNETTPVELVFLNQEDYRRNLVTMIKFVDGQPQVHKQIDGRNIIDGEVVEEGVVS